MKDRSCFCNLLGSIAVNQHCVLLLTVAAKHTETKQFYILYNTLDDTKLYLNKEVSFIEMSSLRRLLSICKIVSKGILFHIIIYLIFIIGRYNW